MIEHDITRRTVAEYLDPLRGAIDTLILGCTHYPLLKGVIAEHMGPDVALVDSAESLAEAAEAELEDQGLAGGGCGRLEFWLSDMPWKFREVGERFLGRPIPEVHTVNLNEAHWEEEQRRKDPT